jgi:CheY-like chemotaxis protein
MQSSVSGARLISRAACSARSLAGPPSRMRLKPIGPRSTTVLIHLALVWDMIATSQIENRPVEKVRVTAGAQPSPEIVCLVDDDPVVLRSTGRLLASDGFTVRPFNKGADFIAYVASHEVPLVVLDIWMKEMTGLEVLARLCAVSPRTHVIVITGREDSAARITAMQMGISALLIKPFDDEQFLALVHRALGHVPQSSSTAHSTVHALPHWTKVP